VTRQTHDKHRGDRTTIAARAWIELERTARDAKTARLRDQRLTAETLLSQRDDAATEAKASNRANGLSSGSGMLMPWKSRRKRC
jgi:hypothetical protein